MPNDLIGYIRERAERPGTSVEGVELLAVLEERLTLELAAAGGTPALASSPGPESGPGGEDGARSIDVTFPAWQPDAD